MAAVLSARRNGSLYEQSNVMLEHCVIARQTITPSYINNNKQAQIPHGDWIYKKSSVSKVTGFSFRLTLTRVIGYCYKENSTYKHYWIQMFRGLVSDLRASRCLESVQEKGHQF